MGAWAGFAVTVAAVAATVWPSPAFATGDGHHHPHHQHAHHQHYLHYQHHHGQHGQHGQHADSQPQPGGPQDGRTAGTAARETGVRVAPATGASPMAQPPLRPDAGSGLFPERQAPPAVLYVPPTHGGGPLVDVLPFGAGLACLGLGIGIVGLRLRQT